MIKELVKVKGQRSPSCWVWFCSGHRVESIDTIHLVISQLVRFLLKKFSETQKKELHTPIDFTLVLVCE